MDERDPRDHFIVATAIIVKVDPDGTRRYLIAKRALHEKAFPGLWTVPGGKLVTKEYREMPPTTAGYEGWYNIIEWLIRKEVREEVNVEIGKPEYATDLVFIRPDGKPVLTLSFWAHYVSGEPKPGKDLTDVAWVTLEEAKGYELIEGIWHEIEIVDQRLGAE